MVVWHEELAKLFNDWHDVKVRGIIGGDKGDDHEITILNRTVM